ncbi:tRNA (cmo5U34)-methyltransferase [Alteromonadaceae bacterium Bs31]|nr:tRNA (cmo5U34)-methyltransferase [Alteromonadaceae bacterium Bs31]
MNIATLSDSDAAQKALMACFDDFYRTAVSLIPFEREAEFSVLDLGAGTGLLSELIQQDFPNCSITLCDLAEHKLKRAMQRFEGKDEKLRFYVSDYIQQAFPENNYDLIVSALSLHHCSTAQFNMVLSKIYAALNPGGHFINADQALGSTDNIEKIYARKWLKDANDHGAKQQDIEKALQAMKASKRLALETQLNLMSAKGFVDLNHWYQYFSFCVYSGVKPMKDIFTP